ncbi:MAG: excinuclease ABC subunit UvrB [Bacilli bacterium]|jgi:excinuclease ABC subunit B|nr:excinuclease ABC subunit UvrB [Bacilli bacterium]
MFKLETKFQPSGDQPQAIQKLVEGIIEGKKEQVLLGATGTGKTFTIANVIQKVNKPTLVLAHNKTLAGQLYAELKELFPENHVEYFVSYYDYYQPEAYVPSSDTYIEKDSSINDEIDELRHAATSALINHRDVIVVSSVSCIYGIGEKEEYEKKMLILSLHDQVNRNTIINKLIDMTYERSDIDFHRGTFRVRGDKIDIIPVNEHASGIRVELFGDEVERIYTFDPVTGAIVSEKKSITISPASHFVTSDEKMQEAIKRIEEELKFRLEELKSQNKLLEEQRLRERTNYDIEMLKETGFCSGVENYSRHLALREEGETPTCLIDFFPSDFLLVVDESHVTLPQVRGMYNGDRMRKQTLVDYGFRLPSALDNRPLKFSEFEVKLNQAIYVSATPGDYEMEKASSEIVEQVIRPTGLLDPTIEIKPSNGQIDDIISQIRERIEKNERVLITTLTIRMSEELSNYLKEMNIKVAYLHNEIKTLERLKIIQELRKGVYDCVVGINLLREGIDIPEVSLICILDADKQGFLRSSRSLIQTIGRCARNEHGHVIMYADTISEAMQLAIDETKRRRRIQEKYNEEHNIVPKTIQKQIKEVVTNEVKSSSHKPKLSKKEEQDIIIRIEEEMKIAAKNLDFERAMELRDILFEMKSEKKTK